MSDEDDGATQPAAALIEERKQMAHGLVWAISVAKSLHNDAGNHLAGTSQFTGEPAMRALITDIMHDMERVQTRLEEVSRIAWRRLEQLREGKPKVTQKPSHHE